MDRQRENLTRGLNVGCRREELAVRLSFLLTRGKKNIQGKRKAKLSLKKISDEEFECLHFELFFAIYSASSAGTFSG